VPTAVLATPAGEAHDLGLLLLALLMLDAGLDVSYLGADLPAAEIVTAARRCDAVLLGLSVVSEGNRAQAVREVRDIQRALPATVELWLGGCDAPRVASRLQPFGGMVISTMAQADGELARLGNRVRPLP
jgi:methylmalonyl-CoA mutase cobalamin-binding subunit